jgi:hypothetical protein
MECPTCRAPAHPDGPDAVVDSSDGPLLLTRWRCANRHWWHGITDACPAGDQSAHYDRAEWLCSEIAMAMAVARIRQSGQRNAEHGRAPPEAPQAAPLTPDQECAGLNPVRGWLGTPAPGDGAGSHRT